MTATTHLTATKQAGMTSLRKTALVAGIFYLITFISIPTLALYGPVKNHRDWILSSGSHTGVLVGGLLEVIVALAGIGTAVTLYPVVKRRNEGVALGFVTSRLLEAAMIFTGVLSLLSLVTLKHDLGGAAGANAAALVTTGAAHVAIYNLTMLLGQTLMPCVNALLLGSLMYRSRLVPRIIPRTHRSLPAHRRRDRNAVRRRHRACLSVQGDRDLPGSCLGVLAGRLAGRQGLQALPRHRWNGGCEQPARLQRRHRLTVQGHGRARQARPRPSRPEGPRRSGRPRLAAELTCVAPAPMLLR